MSEGHPPIAPSSFRCIQCGYDLSGTPIGGQCPECGKLVEQSLRTDAAPQTNGLAIGALVCGILSLFSCAVLGPVAIVMARRAFEQIKTGRYDSTSNSLAKIGLITGIIGTVMVVGWLLFFGFSFVVSSL